jgi:esterase/lipase superfamily enzyme
MLIEQGLARFTRHADLRRFNAPTHGNLLHGNGEAIIFDLTILAAADTRYDAFDLPSPAGLSGLEQLSERVAIYFSRADQVLQLSMVVNLGAKRLGQDGPHNRADPNAFPPGQFDMVDCTEIRDYGSIS